MTEDFDILIRQVVKGEPDAAEQLVQEYEPEIRRVVRFRLRDPRMRRVIDSTDICQSVFGKFFVLAALGRFEFETPEDLVKLLAKMATNRIIDRYRTESSQQKLNRERSTRKHYGEGGEEMDRADFPDNVVARRELLAAVKLRLSENEMNISQLRSQGRSWLEVSQALGESPQALRKRLERAYHRIFDELGIESP